MNDKEEVDYGLNLVKEIMNEIELPNERKEELLDSFLRYKKTSAINTFVLSLSMDSDALILWNNYGKNEGYNLGFRLGTLLDDLSTNNVSIVNDSVCKLVNGRVIYDRSEQKKLLSTLFLAYYKLYKHIQLTGNQNVDNQVSVVKIWTMIILYSSLIKGDLHKMENEYRILLTVPDDSKAVNFRSRNGLILPYVKMKLNNFNALEQITIGPKIDDQITKETLTYFLEKSINKNIRIEPSSLRLRF